MTLPPSYTRAQRWAMPLFGGRSAALRVEPSFGVSKLRSAAAIAILALAACRFDAPAPSQPSDGSEETTPIGYNTVAGYAEMDSFPAARDLARAALSDGVLTEREYDGVIDAANGQRESEYQSSKAAALKKWAKQ